MPNPNKKFVRTVFDEYHDELHRYLLSRLRGRALDAADVAQETYLRLLRMKNAMEQHDHLQLRRHRGRFVPTFSKARLSGSSDLAPPCLSKVLHLSQRSFFGRRFSITCSLHSFTVHSGAN